jgi:hypothetical protein
LGVGLTTLTYKKENCSEASKKFSRICGGGQGLSWAVKPRKEEEEIMILYCNVVVRYNHILLSEFTFRPTSLLASNKPSVFLFVVFMFSPYVLTLSE